MIRHTLIGLAVILVVAIVIGGVFMLVSLLNPVIAIWVPLTILVLLAANLVGQLISRDV